MTEEEEDGDDELMSDVPEMDLNLYSASEDEEKDDTTPTTPTPNGAAEMSDPVDLLSRAERSALCQYEG